MRYHFIFYACLCTILLGFFNCANHPADVSPAIQSETKSEPEIKDVKKYMKDKGIEARYVVVLIDKSEKKLYLRHNDRILKSYPVALGSNSLADKRMQGDNLTPEGDFIIQSKYPHKSWKYFMWINYPTDDSRKKHWQAKKAGLIPQHAQIGGEIGIHGVVEGNDFLVSSGIPWTKGCISLKNADISELYEIIGTGTTLIRIQK
jgi:murein L,D-transpeptidase YafK